MPLMNLKWLFLYLTISYYFILAFNASYMKYSENNLDNYVYYDRICNKNACVSISTNHKYSQYGIALIVLFGVIVVLSTAILFSILYAPHLVKIFQYILVLFALGTMIYLISIVKSTQSDSGAEMDFTLSSIFILVGCSLIIFDFIINISIIKKIFIN